MKKPSSEKQSKATPVSPDSVTRRYDPIECIVIGGSAGAIEALLKILPSLPSRFPVPILAVVHLPPEGRSLLPEIFSQRCLIAVKEAEDKEPILGGMVYFAAPNYHLLVEPNRTLSISSDEPVLYSRPSIDVLFQSAADAFGSGLLALVLTGANSDGSAGSKAVAAFGGKVWVQKPEATTDAVLMPQSVLDACPEARALALSEIGSAIIAAVGAR